MVFRGVKRWCSEIEYLMLSEELDDWENLLVAKKLAAPTSSGLAQYLFL